MKGWVILGLKALLLGGLLAYLGFSLWDDRAELSQLAAIRHGWGWLILAQAFIGLVLLATAYRWRLLLKAQGIEYAFREALVLSFIGFFFNQFIPGSTGGDLVKAYYVAVDHPRRRAAGITTVFLDRVVGLLVLIGVAGAGIVLNRERIAASPVLRSLATVVAVSLVAAGIAGVLFYSARVRSLRHVKAAAARLPFRDILWNVQAAVYVYKRHPGLVAAVLCLSLLVQISIVAMALCYALALGGMPDLGAFLFVVPLAHLALAVPTGSPGGLGQSEMAYRELFDRFGYQHGLLLALVQRVNWCLWGLGGAVFYLRRKDRVRRARELAAKDAAAPLRLEAAEPTCSRER